MSGCTGSRSKRSDWHDGLKGLKLEVKKLKKNEKKTNPEPGSSRKLGDDIGRRLEHLVQLDEGRSQPVFNIEVWKRGDLERLKSENSSLQIENNSLRSENNILQRENNSLEEQRKKNIEVIADLETRITRSEKDNTQWKEQCEKVRKERTNLELKLVQEQGTNDDLQKNINRLQSEINNLEEQRKEAALERENLMLKFDEKEKVIADLETRTARSEKDNIQLREQCEQVKKERTNLELKLDEAQKNNDELQKNVDRLEKEVENTKNENKNLQTLLDEKTYEARKASEAITEYARQWEAQNKTIKDLQRNLNEQRNSIDKLQRNLSEEKKAKENALNRLSAAAANRLRDQNPGITDLSDPNRPLKLAEKVSELYDNEWTNAMENLEGEFKMKEEKGIKLLLKIIKNVFDTCAEFGDAHLAAFPDMLIIPPAILQTEKERTLNVKELPAEILKPMKDFRKSQAKHAINHLQKYFSSSEGKLKLQISEKKFNTCKEYIDKCVELCWMMRIQDPPIYMDTDYPTNSEFDSNKMRSYTKAGKFVNFVVWPTFFLHKDGPLLGKGVVQGSKKEVEDIEESSSESGSSSSDASENEDFDDARSRTDSDMKEGASTDAQKPQQGGDEITPGAGNSEINNTKGNVQEPNQEELHQEEPNGDKHSGQPEGLVKETTDHEIKDNGNNSEGAESKGEIENEEQNGELINDNEDCGE